MPHRIASPSVSAQGGAKKGPGASHPELSDGRTFRSRCVWAPESKLGGEILLRRHSGALPFGIKAGPSRMDLIKCLGRICNAGTDEFMPRDAHDWLRSAEPMRSALRPRTTCEPVVHVADQSASASRCVRALKVVEVPPYREVVHVS